MRNNCKITNIIAVCSCRTKPDQLLSNYEKKLQDFMKTTTVDDYKKYCKEHLLELISSSAEPVTMKLSDQWMKRTLENLKMLTCQLLKVPGSCLHLHVITEDCVAVHWLCPVSIVPALREAILSATDTLQQEGILQIFIGGEAVLGKCVHVCSEILVIPPACQISKLAVDMKFALLLCCFTQLLNFAELLHQCMFSLVRTVQCFAVRLTEASRQSLAVLIQLIECTTN